MNAQPATTTRADVDGSSILVVSQDYELFFGDSGSIEKCLFEPCDALMQFASKRDLSITFYVDAGMLCRMQSLAGKNPGLARMLDRVKQHIESLHRAGHEIGLHVHPHWEDTDYRDGRWQFAGSRYQLRDFTDPEIANIFDRYSHMLNALADGQVGSYRAGGFCVEPFGRIRDSLLRNEITTDSSVVPGALLKDPDKGFDFTRAPNAGWWRFSDSPGVADEQGDFIEIAITPVTLPLLHYWGRLYSRLARSRPADSYGDGRSKAIGRTEVLRRLAGLGRVSELSIDAPKASQLDSRQLRAQHREIWQVMGHPKLLGSSSFEQLDRFIERQRISGSRTVSQLAGAIRQER